MEEIAAVAAVAVFAGIIMIAFQWGRIYERDKSRTQQTLNPYYTNAVGGGGAGYPLSIVTGGTAGLRPGETTVIAVGGGNNINPDVGGRGT